MRPAGVESEPRSQNPDFLILGAGPIGDKAQQLIDKTPQLKELGFRVPHRTILAQGFLDGMRGENITPVYREILGGAIKRYGNTPLMIRSSGAGDARGTGTYKSVAVLPDTEHVVEGIQEVLASYDSESAIAFRRDAKTGEGFGIIIEPMIGQEVGDEYRSKFAPILSGFGYTSTPREKAFVTVAWGMGGGVSSRNGEKLTEEVLEQYDGSLYDYISHSSLIMAMGSEGYKNSSLVNEEMERSGAVFFRVAFGWGLGEGEINLDYQVKSRYQEVNFLPFFENLQLLEDAFGKSQYVEFALTLEDSGSAFWITQIADANRKLDSFDFENSGTPFIEAENVTGSGVIEADTVVLCRNSGMLDQLKKFNDKERGYVLIYWANMIAGGMSNYARRVGGERSGGERSLEYADLSNASVIIEIQNAAHGKDPISHFGGQMEASGKLFATTDMSMKDMDFWDTWYSFWGGAKNEEILNVVSKNVRIVADEKQNRMVVTILQGED